MKQPVDSVTQFIASGKLYSPSVQVNCISDKMTPWVSEQIVLM